MTGFDLRDFTPYLLAMAAEAASAQFQSHYKSKYGMLRTEWRVLFHLGRHGALTAKDICVRAHLHKTKVSRAVAALEKKRYLTRRAIETDRRQDMLTLTKSGEAVFVDLSAAAQAFDQSMQSGMTADERRILRECLLRIANI